MTYQTDLMDKAIADVIEAGFEMFNLAEFGEALKRKASIEELQAIVAKQRRNV